MNLSQQLDKAYDAESSLALINGALRDINAELLDIETFKRLSPEQLDQLVNNFDAAIEMQEKVIGAGYYRAEKMKQLIADLNRKNKELAAEFNKGSVEETSKVIDQPSEDAKKAGQEYVKNVKENLASAISSAFRGDTGGLRDFLKNTFKSLANTIVDALSKGLANAFMKQSGLEDMLANIVTGAMFTGEKTGTKAGGGLLDMAKGAWEWGKGLFGGADKGPTVATVGGAVTAMTNPKFSAESGISQITDMGKSFIESSGLKSVFEEFNSTMSAFSSNFSNITTGTEAVTAAAPVSVEETVATFSESIGGAFDNISSLLS